MVGMRTANEVGHAENAMFDKMRGYAVGFKTRFLTSMPTQNIWCRL